MALIPSVNHRGTGTDAKAVLGVIGDPDGVGRVPEALRATGAAGDAGDGAGGHWCSRRCCPPDLPSMPRWTRRRIEQALKEGTVNGVASTNALELGIDIGGLDAAILASYPGTMMSTWQQAGRAGRGSATALVAFEGPLDQYLARHPKELLSKPHEHAVVDLDNPYILNGHVLCAAAELPISDRDEACFGPKLPDALAHWERNGRLAKTSAGWVYHGRGRPVAEVSLVAINAGRVEVRCNDASGDPSHSSRGRLMGSCLSGAPTPAPTPARSCTTRATAIGSSGSTSPAASRPPSG